MQTITEVVQHSIRYTFVYILCLMIFLVGCDRNSSIPNSSADAPPTISTPLLSETTKITPLTIDSVEAFLSNAAVTPHSQTQIIREEISRIAKDPQIVDALAKQLLTLPVKDIDRHLMILATLGEMRNPEAIQPLVKFIWSDQPFITESAAGKDDSISTTFFNHTGALKARAVEMLAYIGTKEAYEATLEVIAKHIGAEVRIAAIDAFLFNHRDSPEAKAELAKVVLADETKLIGIPRWTNGMNIDEFNARVAEFYRLYPEEQPPVPTIKEGYQNTEKPPISVR